MNNTHTAGRSLILIVGIAGVIILILAVVLFFLFFSGDEEDIQTTERTDDAEVIDRGSPSTAQERENIILRGLATGGEITETEVREYYIILGLTPGAPLPEIIRAYEGLTDIYGPGGTDSDPNRYRDISEAYNTLTALWTPYYTTLGLEPGATIPEITRAYEGLTDIYGPGGTDPDPGRYQDISEAYNVLVGLDTTPHSIPGLEPGAPLTETILTYYSILGLEPGATIPEITRAYEGLTDIYGPGGTDPDPGRYQDISEAYNVLVGIPPVPGVDPTHFRHVQKSF